MSLSTDALAFAVFIYENASHMPPDTSQAPAERRVLQSLRTVASLMRAIAASLFVNNAMIDGEVERMFERCAATVREIAVSVALPDEQSRSRTLSKLFDLLIAACKENWGSFATHAPVANLARSDRAAQVFKVLHRVVAIVIIAAAIYGLQYVHGSWLTDTLRGYILSILIAYDLGLALALFDPDLVNASTRILGALRDKAGQ